MLECSSENYRLSDDLNLARRIVELEVNNVDASPCLTSRFVSAIPGEEAIIGQELILR